MERESSVECSVFFLSTEKKNNKDSKLLLTKSSFEKFNDVFFTAQRKMSYFEIQQRQRRFFHSMVKKITFYKLYM